ncbi:hypothetical protein [Paenibacillus sp. CAA11]|uniref:hypothetical protein n=1 Tax=Paenibacillus sp. CAA11 TaxID=1532905 RepID=UPI00131F25DB|nr:hypothetical protein [Paenibacillus sp. CAA11]
MMILVQMHVRVYAASFHRKSTRSLGGGRGRGRQLLCRLHRLKGSGSKSEADALKAFILRQI